MKSLWITFVLIATCSASGTSFSFAQTSEQSYQKGDERIEKKGDIEAYQRKETNFPKHKNEVTIARKRLNRLTWKQPHLDRNGAAISRGRSPDNASLGKEDTITDHLINSEILITTRGTQPFLHNALQFLKTDGISLITVGILTILSIYILIMLIILLRSSFTNKRERKSIL